MANQALQTNREFGPMMMRLSAQEQLFVCTLFSGAKLSLTKCAELAGYTAVTRNALHQHAHRLVRDPAIAAAVQEESKRRTVFLIPKAQKALGDLLEHSEHADHFKAIKMVRDDGGVTRAVERLLKVDVTIDNQSEKIEAIRRFAEAHPGTIDLDKLLGREPVDAEFEEAPPENVEDLF